MVAEPTVAAVAGARGNLPLLLSGPEQADESGSEETYSKKEGEGDVGLELAAGVATWGNVTPGEDVAAAVTDQLYHGSVRKAP